MQITPFDAFRLLTPLTFQITGLSKDREVFEPVGTGFFVAPYTALTAKHVGDALWDALEMPWKKGKYPKDTVEPEFFIAATQMVHIDRKEIVANWEVTGLTPCNQTDVAFLHVVPRNDIAMMLAWPDGFPELVFLPPPVGAEVWSFGYPGVKHDHKAGEAVVNVTSEPTLVAGEVVSHYQEGRASWRFPQFQVTMGFEPGMSGGPVIHNGKVCGIVSYGPTYEDGVGSSYAAALWPILLSEVIPPVDPRMRSTAVLDLLNSGFLRSRDWREVKSRAYVGTNNDGKEIARLKPPL